MSTRASIGYCSEPHEWHLYRDLADDTPPSPGDEMIYLETASRAATLSSDGCLCVGLPKHVWQQIVEAVKRDGEVRERQDRSPVVKAEDPAVAAPFSKGAGVKIDTASTMILGNERPLRPLPAGSFRLVLETSDGQLTVTEGGEVSWNGEPAPDHLAVAGRALAKGCPFPPPMMEARTRIGAWIDLRHEGAPAKDGA